MLMRSVLIAPTVCQIIMLDKKCMMLHTMSAWLKESLFICFIPTLTVLKLMHRFRIRHRFYSNILHRDLSGGRST